MTTGAYGSQPSWPFLTAGSWSYKTWTGSDGKYETYAGERRSKWNTYTVTASKARCTGVTSTLRARKKGSGGSPPGPVGTFVNSSGHIYHTAVGRPTLSGVVSSRAQSRVLEKLLSKVKGHDFNLGVELGQMNQTVNLLSGNLRKLGGAAWALRRGDFSSAARALGTRPRPTRLKTGDIPGRWLELQYGWLPLLGSSFDAMKAFEAISNGPRSKLFKASVKEEVAIDVSSSPTQHSCVYKGYRWRHLQYEMYEEMSVQRQLGLIDPLSIAWELTPWSFVVDWFLPIGQYLDLLHQIPHLKGRWLVTDVAKVPMQTPVWTSKQSGDVWLEGGSPYCYGYFDTLSVTSWPQVEAAYAWMDRKPLASPPKVPLPSFNLKGVNSSRRFWNAVALATQRFTGKPPRSGFLLQV